MYTIAILVGKLLQKVLRSMRRGGGSFPGAVALRLCPSFIRHVELPKTVILVSGTNGKSTVTNLLAKILQDSGMRVMSNLAGNNMKIGAVSLLLEHMNWLGKCDADALVLEVDELSMPHILEDMVPSHVVIGNLFRDQLDRVGEMESVIRVFESCLASYPNVLLLNGNDPNVCRLALSAKQAKVTYFGVAKHEQSTAVSIEASEGRFCPLCANELVYDYYQYSHIGRFHCLFDSFGSHKIAYEAHLHSINEQMKYVVNDVMYESMSSSLFALYNEVEVIALASLLGVRSEVIRQSIASFQMNNGRMELFQLRSGHPCVLNLAKNPTGVNESLKTLTRKESPCVFAVVLNDLEADGTDVSWIYDARFELLSSPHIQRLYTSGTRMYDMALRLHYGGCIQPIASIEDLDVLVEELNQCDCPVYVIANYTALQPVRKALQRGSV